MGIDPGQSLERQGVELVDAPEDRDDFVSEQARWRVLDVERVQSRQGLGERFQSWRRGCRSRSEPRRRSPWDRVVRRVWQT